MVGWGAVSEWEWALDGGGNMVGVGVTTSGVLVPMLYYMSG